MSVRMGKYMRKTKITGEVSFMEAPHQSTLGVLTRAKTLALQMSSSATPAPSPTAAAPDYSSYIQLRSRRLEKPLALATTYEGGSKSRVASKTNSQPRSPRIRSASAAGTPSVSMINGGSKKCTAEEHTSEASMGYDGEFFGENVLESEASERTRRETTPCSLIRGSESISTPGSTTKPGPASRRRHRNMSCGNIPSTDEMEGFFIGPERLQQRTFTEKYNFDPINDRPLPGRYEWVKLDC